MIFVLANQLIARLFLTAFRQIIIWSVVGSLFLEPTNVESTAVTILTTGFIYHRIPRTFRYKIYFMRKLLQISILIGLTACHGYSSQEASISNANASPAINRAANLKNLKFDYAKDPACGMPLKAGVGDSTQCKGQ